MTSATSLLEPAPSRQEDGDAALGFIDCDIHPNLKSPTALYPYLPKRWQEHLSRYGASGHGPHTAAHAYPLYSPATSRRDAWPPGGGLPGSDLDFMRTQHLAP